MTSDNGRNEVEIQEQQSYRKLYRNNQEGNIAGVCAGLAEYFGVDVTLIRIAFVLATLMGGPGLIFYIVLAFIMPEKSKYLDKNKNDYL